MATVFRNLVIAGIAMAVVAACEKKEEPAPGPAETLGRKIDEAAARGVVELNKMGEHAGRALEKAGETLQRKSEEAKRKDGTDKN